MQHKANYHTFQARKKPESEQNHRRQPDREVHRDGRLQFTFGQQDQRHDDMPDDDHRQVGRKIVGTDMAQFLGAGAALRLRLEEAGEQPGFAAARAGLAESPPHQRGKAGDRRGGVDGGFHAGL